jgi:rhodanese-related sulfurtransferase
MDMWYMNAIVLGVFSLVMLGQCGPSYGQDGTARCHDPAFDKEVRRLLSFTVPVLDVDTVFNRVTDYTLLDAREWEEYKISHLPGARFIGYDDFSATSLKGIDTNTRIVVYCSVGYRSEKIAEKLEKLGYTHVYNLYGSIFEWANRGYPLFNIQDEPVKKVHTYNKKWSRWLTSDSLIKLW